METVTPSAPFNDVAQLKQYVTNQMYSRDPQVSFPAAFSLFKVASMEELMALPARTNSGSLTVMGASWWALFPFVDMATAYVEVDDVLVSNDGYSVVMWGRWNGVCTAAYELPNGESIDLAGKSFKDLRYAYRLTFNRETKKAELFEGLFDLAEFGRLMGSPAYAAASSGASLYPA
jgi:hypothetical protein